MKVMTVEGVVRHMGTILIGRLECDVKLGESVRVGDHPCRIHGIDKDGKIWASAKAGDGVAILIRGIPDVPVEAGWTMSKEQ